MQTQLVSAFAELFAIFVMLGILSALIIVHECGHFSVARFFGFQTPVFGFGLPFGPHWVVGKRWGTEFRVHALLLGGYVAIPELGDESNSEAFGLELGPFRKFPIWQRALVAFAGVAFNMIFAYLVMVYVVATLGLPVQPTTVLGLDTSNPIAAQAGIKPGDEIKKVDDVQVTGTDDLIKYLTQHKEKMVHLGITRADKPQVIDVTPNADGRVGMMLGGGATTYRKISGSPIYIAQTSFTELCSKTGSMIQSIGDLFKGMMPGHKTVKGQKSLGFSDMHGVLAIIKIGADIAKQDWTQLFMFTILISMDLAIMNLIPWPALDGWHLATMTVEGIRGRPMGERAQGEMVKWGFISLLFLMAVIMVNDVTALVQGKLEFKSKSDKTEKIDAKSGQDKTPAENSTANPDDPSSARAVNNGDKDSSKGSSADDEDKQPSEKPAAGVGQKSNNAEEDR